MAQMLSTGGERGLPCEWLSTSVAVSGLPGAPGVPRVELQREGTAASVSWTAPRDDGGCRLDGYVVEYRAETSSRWTRANEEPVRDLDLVVRNLKPDTVYEFRVAAKNKAGVGEFSPSAKPTKGAEEPTGKTPLNIILEYVSFINYSIKAVNKMDRPCKRGSTSKRK